VPSADLTIERRRALQLLAETPTGMTDAAFRAHGFSPTLIVRLVGAATRKLSRKPSDVLHL
jgi:hypothetical protein